MKLTLLITFLVLTVLSGISAYAQEVLSAKEVKRRTVDSKVDDEIKMASFKKIVYGDEFKLETDAIPFIDKICSTTLRYNPNVLKKVMGNAYSTNDFMEKKKWVPCATELLNFIIEIPSDKKTSIDYKMGMILKVRGEVVLGDTTREWGGHPECEVKVEGNKNSHWLGDVMEIMCGSNCENVVRDGSEGYLKSKKCYEEVREVYKRAPSVAKQIDDQNAKNAKANEQQAAKEAAKNKFVDETAHGKHVDPANGAK